MLAHLKMNSVWADAGFWPVWAQKARAKEAILRGKGKRKRGQVDSRDTLRLQLSQVELSKSGFS